MNYVFVDFSVESQEQCTGSFGLWVTAVIPIKLVHTTSIVHAEVES